MSLVISGGQSQVPAPPPDTGGTPVPTLPAVPAPAQPTTANAQPSDAQVQKALDNLRQAAAQVPQNVEFSVDKTSGRTVIKVVDGSTQQVIRQIPSEEVLQMAQALDQMSGLLLRDKA